MKKPVACLLFLLITVPSISETLVLKNGDVVEGKVFQRMNDAIMITTEKDGLTVFNLSEVDTIDGKKVTIPEPAPEGITRTYYSSGAVKNEINKIDGTTKTFFENGKLQSVLIKNDDGSHTNKLYDKQGNLISDGTLKIDEDTQSMSSSTKSFFSDGSVAKGEMYIDREGALSVEITDDSGAVLHKQKENKPTITENYAKGDMRRATSTLRLMSTNAERYATMNSGKYATEFESINREIAGGKLENNCGREISNYKFECEFSSAGYVYRAIPLAQDYSWQTTHTITTGGVLTP